MPAFKPAYLVLGDDHGRIAERRARLRAMAEAETGVGGVEVLEGDLCTADAVIGALTTMTFAMGRRFVIADGVERWKDADVEAVAAAMSDMDGESLTLAMFGREEARYKVPDGLRKAVEKAGGAIAEESGVKPWELPSWVQARGRELGLELDKGAAKALVAQVGERQQRLLRELEKLALEHGEGASIGETEVEESGASSARAQGLDARGRARGRRREGRHARARRAPRPGRADPGLLYNVASRLRDAVEGRRGARGRPAGRRRPRGLRMSPRAAARFVEDVGKRDVDAFRRALEVIADLELETAAAGPTWARSDEDTLGRPRGAGGGELGGARRKRRGAACAARDFLRAPAFLCSAPRLTALSTRRISCRCSVSAASSSPASTAAWRRRKYVLIADV